MPGKPGDLRSKKFFENQLTAYRITHIIRLKELYYSCNTDWRRLIRRKGKTMNCPNCGAPMEEGYIYCSSLVRPMFYLPKEIKRGLANKLHKVGEGKGFFLTDPGSSVLKNRVRTVVCRKCKCGIIYFPDVE